MFKRRCCAGRTRLLVVLLGIPYLYMVVFSFTHFPRLRHQSMVGNGMERHTETHTQGTTNATTEMLGLQKETTERLGLQNATRKHFMFVEDDTMREYIQHAVHSGLVKHEMLEVKLSGGRGFRFAQWNHDSVDNWETLGTADRFFQVKKIHIFCSPTTHRECQYLGRHLCISG